VLRAFFASPGLAHATSVAFHLLLFAGVTALFRIHLSRASQLVRLLGFVLLGLLVVPSAVRWLEDGMETGLVLDVTDRGEHTDYPLSPPPRKYNVSFFRFIRGGA
jgi:hypothetical protein